MEFASPGELIHEQGVVFARQFVAEGFFDRSMVADINVHWDVDAKRPTRSRSRRNDASAGNLQALRHGDVHASQFGRG
jgi:hypothetical protein